MRLVRVRPLLPLLSFVHVQHASVLKPKLLFRFVSGGVTTSSVGDDTLSPPFSWPSLLGASVFGAIVGATLYLGAWQWERYGWKKALLVARLSALTVQPADISFASADSLAALASAAAADIDARLPMLVRVSGELDLTRGVLLRPRAPPGGLPDRLRPSAGLAGAQLLAPLRLGSGGEALLLRGWWPLASAPSVGTGAGVERLSDVLAVVRASERPSAWVPFHHAPDKGDFAWLDAPAMIRFMGIRAGRARAESANDDVEKPALFLEVIETPPTRRDKFPLARSIDSLAIPHTTPLTHLVYAATWLSLSAFGTAIAWLRFRRPAPGRYR